MTQITEYRLKKSKAEVNLSITAICVQKWRRCVAVNRPQKGISFHTNLAVDNGFVAPQRFLKLSKTAKHPSTFDLGKTQNPLRNLIARAFSTSLCGRTLKGRGRGKTSARRAGGSDAGGVQYFQIFPSSRLMAPERKCLCWP